MRAKIEVIIEAASGAMNDMRAKREPSPVGVAAAQAIGFGAKFARALMRLPVEHRESAIQFLREFSEGGENSRAAMMYKTISGEQ